MLVDLVQVTCDDGVRLHGALETPSTGDSQPNADLNARPNIDVWLCIHGTGSNFYAGAMLGGLTPKLLAAGSAVLRANTRGHDVICTGPAAGGRSLLGAAFERVDEAQVDIAQWLGFLAGRGFTRIGLLGHSLGAIKAILTMAEQPSPLVKALVAASPPRLSYKHFRGSRQGSEFQANYEQARQLVADGRGDELLLVRFPIAYYVSAAGFVDRYGPDEKYNILHMLERVTVPTLVTYGSQELQVHDAFRGMPEQVEPLATAQNRLQVAVIAGADHQYTACHDSLFARIDRWARRLEIPVE